MRRREEAQCFAGVMIRAGRRFLPARSPASECSGAALIAHCGTAGKHNRLRTGRGSASAPCSRGGGCRPTSAQDWQPGSPPPVRKRSHPTTIFPEQRPLAVAGPRQGRADVQRPVTRGVAGLDPKQGGEIADPILLPRSVADRQPLGKGTQAGGLASTPVALFRRAPRRAADPRIIARLRASSGKASSRSVRSS